MISKGRSRTIYLLKRAEILLRNGLEAALQDSGVTVAQYVVLSLLGNSPEASSAEIARRAGVTPQTISETIANFEKRALIERTQSPDHRRILRINVTEAGGKLLKSCEAKVDRLEQALLTGFEDQEVRAFRDYLKRILAAEMSRVPA